MVNFPAHPHYDAVRKVLPEFTKETGIEVEVDQLQYLKMRERQTLELTKSKGDYDLIAYVVFSKADYVFADQLENLARFFMNPKLADPNYDADDLVTGYVENIGIAGGKKGYLPGPDRFAVRHSLRLRDLGSGLSQGHFRKAQSESAGNL